MQPYTRNILRRDGKPGSDPRGKIKLRTEDFLPGEQPKQIRVKIYNYGIDGNLLRDEHKQWLKSQLFPFLREYRYHVKLRGRASGSGSRGANRRVSLERVLLLKEYLVEQGGLHEAQVPGDEMQANGNGNSNAKDSEDPRDRAVEIVLSPGWKTKPSVPVRMGEPIDWDFNDGYEHDPVEVPSAPNDLPSTPYDPPRRKYRIRYIEGYGAAFMFGGDVHQIEILDVTTRQRKRFTLTTVSAAIGAHYSPGPPVETWSNVFTSNAQKLSDFDGRSAAIGSVGGGGLSSAGIAILGADRVEIDTGRAIGPSATPVSGGYGELSAK